MIMYRLPFLAAFTALALWGTTLPAHADNCHDIFVAGRGVLNSCTLEHWVPPTPLEPTIIYVEVDPTINVDVSPQVFVSNNITNNVSASSNAGSNASVTVVTLPTPKRKPAPKPKARTDDLR